MAIATSVIILGMETARGTIMITIIICTGMEITTTVAIAHPVVPVQGLSPPPLMYGEGTVSVPKRCLCHPRSLRGVWMSMALALLGIGLPPPEVWGSPPLPRPHPAPQTHSLRLDPGHGE
eukprot:TRINITY_DN9321_c0_g1::TRINITY_DN9321_c0_g1_i1::g.28404::m.28404 TRINITY_DN9321_c0_g1::TRINITY_DN9321_c0_g1_i1::g.28404  ORF type:complete len:120 (-),score=-21.74,Toxin_11/PF07473.6/0.15 TRINITY_DN9321_c0_g1_i1:410-769(-)